MRITADKDKCQGYASCVIKDPEVFDLDDEGKVKILVGEAPDTPETRDAVNACPMKALTIVEE